MRKIAVLVALNLLCFQPNVVCMGSQERPRREREKETQRPPEKADKWDRGQRKNDFKSAAEGRSVERKRSDPESRRGGEAKRVDKASKWDRGQYKGEFKRAVEGKVREKKQPERRNRTGDVARRVDKTTKWERSAKDSKLVPGKHTERFNEAANPKSPPGGGGSRTGNGGAAPPAGPAPKPPKP